jgi:hypothetical protein
MMKKSYINFPVQLLFTFLISFGMSINPKLVGEENTNKGERLF